MTSILGISAFYHDSAAALIVDGDIVAAAQEERFTRIKHDSSYPINAIEYVLSEASITLEQVDYAAFYDKPFLKFERLLETYVAFAPKGLRQKGCDNLVLQCQSGCVRNYFLKIRSLKSFEKLTRSLILINFYSANTTLAMLLVLSTPLHLMRQ